MERFINLSGGAAEFNGTPAAGNAIDTEAVGLKPIRERLNIRLRRTELIGELFGREPGVKER
jgi:hypothetical protein